MGVAGGLFALAVAVGAVLRQRGVLILAESAPLVGDLDPHVGPGTLPAIAVAALVAVSGRTAAHRLPWWGVLLAASVAATAWALSLAMVSGWQEGIAGRLTEPTEYLGDVDRVGSVLLFLQHFSDSVMLGSDQPWRTHVAGHPPGALLAFVALHRIGLDGGAAAAMVCLLAGVSAVPAVASTVKAVAGEEPARAVLPYLVLFPGFVWAAVSADALFMAVGAWGLLALALAGRRLGAAAAALSVLAGLLLGATLFLSFGMVLLAPLAVALAWRQRAWVQLVTAGVASLGVVAGFALAGWWWWDGFLLVRERYLQGWGGARPYSYWAWADMAALLAAVGPATVAGLRRCLRDPDGAGAYRLLPLVALGIVLTAAATGLSKAEVERIWLPFAIWLPVACAALPAVGSRWWLAAQAATALAVEHLVRVPW